MEHYFVSDGMLMKTMKKKRKELEELDQVNEDFSDFSLSSPARMIRRLDAHLPPNNNNDTDCFDFPLAPQGFLLSFLELWSPEISGMKISPGDTWGSRVRETKSLRPSTVQPKKSNPGPRLATMAGAKALTEGKTGSGLVKVRGCLEGKERLQRRWRGLGFDDGNGIAAKSLNGD